MNGEMCACDTPFCPFHDGQCRNKATAWTYRMAPWPWKETRSSDAIRIDAEQDVPMCADCRHYLSQKLAKWREEDTTADTIRLRALGVEV